MEIVNKKMLKSLGARIRLIRKALKLSQTDFAKLFDLKQGVISQWEIGETDVDDKYIEIIIAKLNVNEAFIRFGSGEPFSVTPTTNEPMVVYKKAIVFSPEQIIARFSETVNAYQVYNNKTQKEVSELIEVNYTYLSNILNGRNIPTIEIVYKAYKRIGINPNYLIIGLEPKFLK